VRTVLLIARRELSAYFATPVGGTLLLIAGLLFGLLFIPGDQRRLIAPLSFLTGFRPADASPGPALLLVALARIVMLVAIPLIAARLFVEERQSRTIELLFTSPASDVEIILGKWLGAVSLYLLIIAVSLVELAAVSLWRHLDWRTVALTYPALIFPSCGLLAVGECFSMSTRHQTVAAAGTITFCLPVLLYLREGVLGPADYLFCAALMLAGWFLTARSIRGQRGQPA
jgi:ABC-2 type transport system permease protein